MDVKIRPARKNDAAHVAVLMDIAAHGIESAFWAAEQDPDHSLLSVARTRIIEDTSLAYHLSRSRLLDVGGDVAGVLIGGIVQADAGIPSGFPPFLAPVLELETAAANHWAVIAVAIYPEHRGRGLAKLLLNHALELAVGERAAGLSLVVEDTNTPALSLYSGMGFVERDSRPWLPYGTRRGPSRWLLLTRGMTHPQAAGNA